MTSIFGQAFALIRHYPVATLGSVFFVGILPALVLLTTFFMVGVNFGLFAWSSPFIGLFAVLAPVMAGLIIGHLAIQSAMTRAATADAHGDHVSLRDCLGASYGKFLSLLGLTALMTLGIIGGSILLIAPGIFVALMWSVSAPALVGENIGFLAALRRSQSLTAGHRWKILRLGMAANGVFWLILWAFNQLAFAIGSFGGAIFSLPESFETAWNFSWQLLLAVLWTICVAFSGAVSAYLYLALRTIREGPLTRSLAEVFA